MLNFNDLRDQVKEWSDRNFGSNEQDARPHRPLLGMFEEAGELVAASEVELDIRRPSEDRQRAYDDIQDAIADLLIFGADYASRKGWDYEELASRPHELVGLNIGECLQLMKHLGVMAHCHLKTEQGIRGDAAKHDARAQDAMSWVFYELNLICARKRWDLRGVVAEVWERVRKRDFTKNKLTGEATSGNPA